MNLAYPDSDGNVVATCFAVSPANIVSVIGSGLAFANSASTNFTDVVPTVAVLSVRLTNICGTLAASYSPQTEFTLTARPLVRPPKENPPPFGKPPAEGIDKPFLGAPMLRQCTINTVPVDLASTLLITFAESGRNLASSIEFDLTLGSAPAILAPNPMLLMLPNCPNLEPNF